MEMADMNATNALGYLGRKINNGLQATGEGVDAGARFTLHPETAFAKPWDLSSTWAARSYAKQGHPTLEWENPENTSNVVMKTVKVISNWTVSCTVYFAADALRYLADISIFNGTRLVSRAVYYSATGTASLATKVWNAVSSFGKGENTGSPARSGESPRASDNAESGGVGASEGHGGGSGGVGASEDHGGADGNAS